MIISNSKFLNLKALNRTNIISEKPFGIAGAIYYGCSNDDP
jgi:hypothetical protein